MYHGKGAWHFITLPEEDSEQIKFLSSQERRGWGSVRVTASIGQTTWKTSVFPDTKAGAYLLPVNRVLALKEPDSQKACVKGELFSPVRLP